MSIRALVVAGTRPEIIKLAPLVVAARTIPEAEVVLCFTGQHRAMADDAFRMFDIHPDVDLDLMKADQTLNHIGSAVLTSLPAVIEKTLPDVVIVQGDTTTAAFAAVTSFHQRIPVAHVEAGLRSHRLDAPFPEEANRRLISVVASHHFCPTDRAARALSGEGIGKAAITVTGNTVVDALQLLQATYPLNDLAGIHPEIRSPFVLVTAHRRESFGDGFERICHALRTSAHEHPDLQFVYPVHMNPNVQGPVRRMLADVPNILLTEPVPYLEVLTLLKHCSFVVTDSGGIQEEAPSFGKYCIVLREVTERMESVEEGMSELVGSDADRIVHAVRREAVHPTHVGTHANPYGDGKAARRIWEVLCAS